MKFEPYMNDLLDQKIKNLEDLTNHFDLVERLEKSFYFRFEYDDDLIRTNSLPFTEISVKLFEKALEELYCPNRTSNSKQKLSKFNLKYATRLSRKSFVSPYCLILALIYLKRLKQINPAYVKSQSACDLFLISLIVSSKFLYGEGTEEAIFNEEWATISGINIKKLNEMEITFLCNLEWRACVEPIEFMEELIKIENLVIQSEFKKRSYRFITYTEIRRIMENDKVYQSLVLNFVKLILIASFSYLSVAFTLVLLSKSTMLQNNLIQNQNSINQTHYSSYGYDKQTSDQLDDYSQEDDGSVDELIEESIEDTNLSSKALNMNKLNTLDLNELNNTLKTLNGLMNENEAHSRSIKRLAVNVYTIQQADHDQRCELSNFNKLIAALSNQSPIIKNKNHNHYNFKKELSLLNIHKVFLQSKVY